MNSAVEVHDLHVRQSASGQIPRRRRFRRSTVNTWDPAVTRFSNNGTAVLRELHPKTLWHHPIRQSLLEDRVLRSPNGLGWQVSFTIRPKVGHSKSGPQTIVHMKELKIRSHSFTGYDNRPWTRPTTHSPRTAPMSSSPIADRRRKARSVAAEVEQLGRKAALLRLDVADLRQFDEFSSSVRQAVESKWQRNTFDFLVNNAGIDSAAPFEKMSEENFDRLFLVHFKGVGLS